MTAPMTAGEAADAMLAAYVAHNGPLAELPNTVRDWFAAHWPQPVGVDVAGIDIQQAFTDAGAPLNSYQRGASDEVAEALSDPRHAAAPAPTPNSGFASSSVGVAAPVVVEVTGEDVQTVASYFDRDMGDLPEVASVCARFAELLNARLRARAADVVPCRVVRRPVETVSTLVVPEDGIYATRYTSGGHAPVNTEHDAGDTLYDDRIAAIRRIDTDAPTTWIERTATAGGWTAESVAACVGQRRVASINEGQRGYLCDWAEYDAATIAARFNDAHVTAYYILPPVEVQP